MYPPMTPKDFHRLSRSTNNLVERLEKDFERNSHCSRWHPDPVLVEKYHLIEFL